MQSYSHVFLLDNELRNSRDQGLAYNDVTCDRKVLDYMNSFSFYPGDPMEVAEDIVGLATGWQIVFVSTYLDPNVDNPSTILLKRPPKAIPPFFVVMRQSDH